MRVLLVDDEEELVATLAERLEMRGCSVTWFTDDRTALAVVEKRFSMWPYWTSVSQV